MRIHRYDMLALGVALLFGLACLQVFRLVLDLDAAGYRIRQEQDTSQRLSQFRFGLERHLNTAFMATTWIDVYWPGKDFQAPQGLNEWADDVMQVVPFVRSIGVAEGYVLKHLFPLQGNEGAVGMDYRTNPDQWPAVKALIERREPMVAGPLKLVQGGTGIVYRKALFDRQGELLGIISMVLDIGRLLEQSGLVEAQSNLELAIRGIDGKGAEGAVFLGDAALFAEHNAPTQTVHFPGGEWQIAAAPLGGWPQGSPNTSRLQWIGALISLVLVISSFFAVSNTGRKLERSQEYRLQLASEVEQRTRDLEQARQRAEDANQAKSRFLAAVTHELRTPLTAIIGLNQLARESSLDHATRQDYLDKIAVSAQLLLGLINDILSYAKIESGHDSFRLRSFDLQKIADNLHTMFQVSCEQKGLDFKVNWDTGLQPWRRGDDERILQVLTNLVGNAIKFTDQGSIDVSIHAESDEIVEFSVRDTGLGMSAAQQARLFQPFVQAHGDLDRRFEGSGLGLSIAQRQVQRMGGRIELESTEGQGSRFFFRLSLPVTEPPQQQEDAENVEPPAFEDLHLLVAEDNPVIQLLVAKLLDRVNIRYRIAKNGQEVLALLEQDLFDGIIMDIQMPLMDGLETTRRIRLGRHRLIPIVALSANAMEEDRARALAAGLNDFAAKPINAADFYAALKRNFDNGARRRDSGLRRQSER